MTILFSSSRTDQELITDALRGDTHAYGEVVVRYRNSVVNVVYRMCGDAQLAEEAAQEAFIRAWQHLSRYRPDLPFRAWIFRIAINAALDAIRSGKRLFELDDMDEDSLVEESPNPELLLVQREQVKRVRKAVLELPPPSRSALVLREYGGMSYADIATALEIPIGTVMSRLNSARSQLRVALAGMMEAA